MRIYLKNSLITIEDANENITCLRLTEIYIKYSWSALILLKETHNYIEIKITIFYNGRAYDKNSVTSLFQGP